MAMSSSCAGGFRYTANILPWLGPLQGTIHNCDLFGLRLLVLVQEHSERDVIPDRKPVKLFVVREDVLPKNLEEFRAIDEAKTGSFINLFHNALEALVSDTIHHHGRRGRVRLEPHARNILRLRFSVLVQEHRECYRLADFESKKLLVVREHVLPKPLHELVARDESISAALVEFLQNPFEASVCHANHLLGRRWCIRVPHAASR
mmetsp:Transcript_11650/g.31260  ORF Transcript_11650/g.31260 Transcript_11650/m.31260 type:complete len:205 (+) Transcript_11650:56-670(+)